MSFLLPFGHLFHSPEDHYLRTPYGNFIRILRIIALFIAVFTSSFYIAITNFHVGMIPPDLLMAIAGTRERVPFPSLIEVLMMEIAFELIREAGLRVPSPIGPTIGIVGALILGQAAVQANIISPIVIIVIALSGLSSFIISDVSMNFAIRMIRFLFIFSAGFYRYIWTYRFIYCWTLLFSNIKIIWYTILCTNDAVFLLIKGPNYPPCSNERKISARLFKTKGYGQTRKGLNVI